MIKTDTMPANPSKTTQLKPIFTFAAEGFEDADVVDEVLLPVLLDVLLPPVLEVPVLASATG